MKFLAKHIALSAACLVSGPAWAESPAHDDSIGQFLGWIQLSKDADFQCIVPRAGGDHIRVQMTHNSQSGVDGPISISIHDIEYSGKYSNFGVYVRDGSQTVMGTFLAARNEERITGSIRFQGPKIILKYTFTDKLGKSADAEAECSDGSGQGGRTQ